MTIGYVEAQNLHLERADLGAQAMWLSGDDVQRLATVHNPNGPGTSPAWLSGPGPLNYWRLHFALGIGRIF